MNFKLTSEQENQLQEWWENEVKPEAYQLNPDPSMPGEPYYGAISGGLTYSFTPTGLGTIVKVQEALTGKEIDLTDYESW